MPTTQHFGAVAAHDPSVDLSLPTLLAVAVLNTTLGFAYLALSVYVNRKLLRRNDALRQQESPPRRRATASCLALRDEQLKKVPVASDSFAGASFGHTEPDSNGQRTPEAGCRGAAQGPRPDPPGPPSPSRAAAFPSIPYVETSAERLSSNLELDELCSRTPLLAANRTPLLPSSGRAADADAEGFTDGSDGNPWRCWSDGIGRFYLLVVALCLCTATLLFFTTFSTPTDPLMACRMKASRSRESDFMTLPVAALEYGVLAGLVFALYDSTPDWRGSAERRALSRAVATLLVGFTAAAAALLFAAEGEREEACVEAVEWLDVAVALIIAGCCVVFSFRLPARLDSIGLDELASKTQATLRVCAVALLVRACVLSPPVQRRLPAILPYSLPVMVSVNAVPVVLCIAILRSR